MESPFFEYSSFFKTPASFEGINGAMAPLIRAHIRAKEAALALFNEEGKIDWGYLSKLKEKIASERHFASLDWIEDSSAILHLEKMVDFLIGSKSARDLIQRLSRPEFNPIGEKMVRLTMGVAPDKRVEDRDVQESTLSALFSYLRQTIGSCFATAVAIYVKEENPLQFLRDVEEILIKGHLLRIRGGKEFIAPICLSPGTGELRRPIFLDLTDQASLKILLESKAFKIALPGIDLFSILKKINRKSVWITPEKIIEMAHKAQFSISEEVLEKYKNVTEIPPSFSMNRVAIQKIDRFNIERYFKAVNDSKERFYSFSSHALLRTWEYTLASFAEAKGEFSSWNLYQSLGIDPLAPDGIGSTVQSAIEEKRSEIRLKVDELALEYDYQFALLKSIEGRFQAADEKQMQWIRMEFLAKQGEVNAISEMRNREIRRLERLASLYKDLIDRAFLEFPDFFQEVYDPEIEEVKEGFFDDRPAGFRLIAKEGRRRQSAWTKIEGPQAFSEALARFFISLETGLIYEEEFKGLEKDLSEIISTLVLFIRSERFQEASLFRMMRAHNLRIIQEPLKHLDRIEKKPWVYTSGGNLHNLVTNYFALSDEKPSGKERWVETETELALFLIDYMKGIPHKNGELFLKDPKKSLLMHSPTHAFCFRPGLYPFSDCWQSDQYSYTYLRDYHILPMERFYETTFMREPELDFLTQEIRERASLSLKERLVMLPTRHGEVMNSRQFAHFLMGNDFTNEEEIATLLYSFLPILSRKEVIQKVGELLNETPFEDSIGAIDKPEFSQLLNREYFFGKEIIALSLALICFKRKAVSFSEDVVSILVKRARALEIIGPDPLIFADTNWPGNYFAFLVSPVTSKVELWRCDPLALFGSPMTQWREWLNGSKQTPTWGVLDIISPFIDDRASLSVKRQMASNKRIGDL